MLHGRTSRICGLGMLAVAMCGAGKARAQQAGFAVPPPPDGPYEVQPPPPPYDDEYRSPPPAWSRPESGIRLALGPSGRATADSLRPGLYAAADLGKGPAGLRLSGTWVRIGYDDPLAQYTGEMTLDFGKTAWHPVLGVGAGLARTYAVDSAGARTSGGANLGIGIARAGLDYRFFPRDDVDARVGVGVIGALPVMRAEDAPALGPWAIIVATIGIGL